MTIDELRAKILAAVEAGQQPNYSDVAELVQADPVLGVLVEQAVRLVIGQARQMRLATLSDRFHLLATAA